MTHGKKLLLSIIILLCAAITLAAFAACDPTVDPSDKDHTHSWSAEWTVDVEPTCTEKGSKSHHCNDATCNEKNDVTEIDAKGHGELVKHDEVANSCIAAGAEAYWQCSDCHKLYSDADCKTEITAAVVIPASHNLTHHEEVAKTCTDAGVAEYWECSACHKMYSDEACEHEIEQPATIPASHGTIVHHEQVDKTCATNGAEEYWECPDCHKLYSDSACENEIEQPAAIPASHGTIEFHAKVDNACDVDGTAQYWQCPDCHKFYSDEACEHEIAEPQTIPATGHGELIHHNGVVATCLMGGAEEYWECPVCSRFYSDEQCATLIEHAQLLPIDPNNHGNGLKAVAEVPASCTNAGAEAHYKCAFCSKLYSDAAGENEILSPAVIPATGHDFATDDDWTIDVAASCETQGSKSHHCQNAGCTEKTDVTVIEARGHHGEAQEVAANTADKKTVTTLGGTSVAFTLVKHYVCPDCNKKFSDAELTKEVTAVYAHSRNGSWLELGNNTIFTNAGAYSCYVAQSNGYYTFTVSDNVNLLQIAMQSKENSTSYTNNKWNAEAVHYDRFTEHPEPLGNTITVYLAKGEILVLRASNKECSILVEKSDEPLIEEGQNTIEITVENDAIGVDSYKFVPTETKTYSLRVPAGMTVAMDDKAFISSGDYANFKATAGKAIKFSFTHSVIGEYTVTIGDEVLPIMTLGEALEVTEYPGFGETFSFVLDESIEEGEYKLTATGITRESFYIIINLEGEIVINGSNIDAQSDWLYFTAGQTNKTVTLKGGDTITLVNPVSGTSVRTISFTLTKVS